MQPSMPACCWARCAELGFRAALLAQAAWTRFAGPLGPLDLAAATRCPTARLGLTCAYLPQSISEPLNRWFSFSLFSALLCS